MASVAVVGGLVSCPAAMASRANVTRAARLKDFRDFSGQDASYIKTISLSRCLCQKPSPFRLLFYSFFFVCGTGPVTEMEPQRAMSGKRKHKKKQAMQQTTVSLPELVSTEWMPLKGGLVVIVLAQIEKKKKSQLGAYWLARVHDCPANSTK